MRANTLSSAAICPVNFKYFSKINEVTRDLDSSLLFAKLKFHQVNSKLKKGGRTWIVRSREQMAAWFGFSLSKVDNILSSLESQGLLEKKVSLWYGERRTFLSVSDQSNPVPVNMQSLEALTQISGSLRAALVFSRIAFAFANTTISHGEKKWCCIKREDLSKWSGLSVRTIDSILNALDKKSLLIRGKFSWGGRVQSHFHIPESIIQMVKKCSDRKKEEKMAELLEVTNSTVSSKNCRSWPAKMTGSLRLRSKRKETSNNRSDIIFDRIGNKLSDRQDSYLRKALNRVIEKKQIRVSNPIEVLQQIRFSITNPQQHKGISSFRHALSRCLKILNDGNWRDPIGFNNHSDIGRELKEQQIEREKSWAEIKERGCKREPKSSQKGGFRACFNLFSGSVNQEDRDDLTQQALKLAKEMKQVAQNVGSGGQGVVVMVENLSSRIQTLIRNGADRQAVSKSLKD